MPSLHSRAQTHLWSGCLEAIRHALLSSPPARAIYLYEVERGRYRTKRDLNLSAKQIREEAPTIVHRNQIDARHRLEQLARDMIHATDALRGHIDLARIGFRIGDELGDCLGRHRWSDLHYGRNAKNACNWLDVADEVEVKFVIKSRIKRVCMSDPEKRVAISHRMRD